MVRPALRLRRHHPRGVGRPRGARTPRGHLAIPIFGRQPLLLAAGAATVTDDPDDVRATAAARMGFYDTVPSYAAVVAEEGVERAADLALIGDEDTVAAGLRRYYDAGVTEIVLTNTDLGGPKARTRTWQLAGALVRSHAS